MTDLQLEQHEAALDDGRRVLFRPILAGDKERLQTGLAKLSPESRYQRFFSTIDHFSERQLRYLTEIDYVNHFAWVALLPDEPGSPGIGVGRWVRLNSEPEAAEGAVTVTDEFHGQGIGKTLLWLTAHSAIERGIKRFRVWTLGDNLKVQNLLADLGAVPGRIDSGVTEFLVPLPDDPADLDGTPAPLVLRAVAEGRVSAVVESREEHGTRLD